MKRVAALLFIIIFIFSIAATWWKQGHEAPQPFDKTEKIFVIKKGISLRQIGNSLKKENLIKDPVIFFLTIRLAGKDKEIQAGDYRLSPSMNLDAIIKNLKHGTLDVWITFPEGKRAEEFGEILKQHMKGYNNIWNAKLSEHEGYLFPDTYLIPRDADIDTIISLLQNTFFAKVKEFGLDQSSPELSKTVTLASIIEREARNNEEKSIIAGILLNRIALGMPLQVDATVQYAKGYDATRKTWWPIITQDDYKNVRSAYNTYLFTGFPPGPISNPGISSFQAALHPTSTQYLFYLHDRNGKIHYAKTSEEHEGNVAKYIHSY